MSDDNVITRNCVMVAAFGGRRLWIGWGCAFCSVMKILFSLFVLVADVQSRFVVSITSS
jgi:hypothetical protein